ncbi:MAG: restriction endonuclease [Arthrobacter sp.]
MTGALLGWDPVWPEAWQPDYQAAAAVAAESGFFRAVWDISGAADGLEPGSDVWFAVSGERPGVAGHGVVVSAPYAVADPQDDPEARMQLVDLDIDMLLPLGEPVLLADLPPEIPGLFPEPGGVARLGRSTGEDLRRAWSRSAAGGHNGPPGPLPGSLPQQAVRWSLASRYEHDPDAARICQVHHGTACSVCGLDPQAVFGTEASGVLQVHHIVPPALLTASYELDPVTDLVPLCPTCHAVAHTGFPDPYTPAELRRLLAARAAPLHDAVVQGALLSPDQLHAEAEARDLLGLRHRGNETAD